jgi:hypothetical protein
LRVAADASHGAGARAPVVVVVAHTTFGQVVLKMTAYRTKPRIGETERSEAMPGASDDQMGCIVMPLGAVISYIVLSAITRVLFNAGSKLDQIICHGTLILFAIGLVLAFLESGRDSMVGLAEKEKWMAACTVAQMRIVERYEGGCYDDGYRIRCVSPSLDLEMNADQRAVSPNATTVRVKVDGHIYNKLAKSDSVRIHYLPEAPLAFLLEEET